MAEAAKCWIFGGAVLLSPACSSFNQYRNKQNRGENDLLPDEINRWGCPGRQPQHKRHKNKYDLMRTADRQSNQRFAPRFCEGKLRSKNNATQTSMKGRDQRQNNE